MSIEVKIGVQNVARELTATAEETAETILEALQAALKDNGLFSITDAKGLTVAVPADKVAYLYFVSDSGRKVGFGL